MIIQIAIDKETADDCPLDCFFRKDDFTCTLFNSKLIKEGYPDAWHYEACEACKKIFMENGGDDVLNETGETAFGFLENEGWKE